MTEVKKERPETEVFGARLLNAPPEQVFRAFTHADHLNRWWGPKGFTNTTEHFDPRPGGRWRLVMHGPDGAEYPNVWEFTALERPYRIEMTHLEPGHYFDVTANLEDEGSRTRLTWLQRFRSADDFDRAIIEDAMEQMFDRLDAELERMRS